MPQYFKHYYRCENKSKYCNYSSAYTAIHNTLFETVTAPMLSTVFKKKVHQDKAARRLTYYKFKTVIFKNLLQYIYVFLFVDK